MLQLSIFQSQVPCLTTDDGLNVQGDVGRKNVKWFGDNLVPRVLSYPAGRREPWEQGWFGDHFNFMGIIQAISKLSQASVSRRG